MMFSKVRGAVGGITGVIRVPVDGAIPLDFNAELDAASINTGTADRDTHLRSADFLQTEQHPKIAFASTSVNASSDTAFTVVGDLTIRGVTRPVTLQAELDGEGRDPWGYERIAYSATTKINRKDFGANWNQALETGGVLVGDELDIRLTIQAVAQATA
jgi:polyisoprenoid-binding protein YceI